GAAGEHGLAVACTDDLVVAVGGQLAVVAADPGADQQLVADESRQQVLQLVLAGHHAAADAAVIVDREAQLLGMRPGRLLQPAQVNDVVGMSHLVDVRLIDDHPLDMGRRYFPGQRLHRHFQRIPRTKTGTADRAAGRRTLLRAQAACKRLRRATWFSAAATRTLKRRLPRGSVASPEVHFGKGLYLLK